MSAPDRFDELLGQELAGKISDAERRELDRMCAADAALAAERREAMDFELDLLETLPEPPLDLKALQPAEVPDWMRHRFDEAAGFAPHSAIKEQAVARKAEAARNWWRDFWRMPARWAVAAAVLALVALPIALSLRDGGAPDPANLNQGGVRSWGSEEGGDAVLLSPRGSTAFSRPAFVWLPSPGKPGPATLLLGEKGAAKPLWEKLEAKPPLRLTDEPSAPALEPGKTYRWEVLPAGGGPAAATEFTVAAEISPVLPAPASATDAVALAEAAEKAGRPADGIMILALLPAEWRADESVRTLRLRLMNASGALRK